MHHDDDANSLTTPQCTRTHAEEGPLGVALSPSSSSDLTLETEAAEPPPGASPLGSERSGWPSRVQVGAVAPEFEFPLSEDPRLLFAQGDTAAAA